MRWLGLAVFAALPLQWFVLGGSPLGAVRAHQTVLLLVVGVLLVTRRPRVLTPVLRVALPFVGLNVLLLTAWTAIALYHGSFPGTAIQEFIYLTVFVVIGAYMYRAATGEEPGALEALKWSAAAAVSVFIVALTLSMVKNGVNPGAVLSKTISTANPEVLQKELFRSSFAGYGYDAATVQGNIRHEIFGAILASMYVTVWAERLLPSPKGMGRTIRYASLFVASGLLLVSMSRAVLIAALLWPAISLLRSLRRRTLTRRQAALGGLTALALTVLAYLGVVQVVWARFTQDTSSYQSRVGRYDSAFTMIRSHFWTGVGETTASASHNYVVDAWLRGGVFLALVAASVVVVLLASWAIAVLRVHLEPEWMVPVTAAFALPLVRMLTSGTGLIPPVSWVTLGFVAGALAYRRTSREAEKLEASPAPVGAPVARWTGG